MQIRRIKRLIIKEILQTVRDRRMLALLFIAPVMQLMVFSYAISTDINHTALAVQDEERSAESRELITRVIESGYFEFQAYLDSPRQIDEVLDNGEAQVVLHIPRGFSKQLAKNRPATVQTILDGSDSMSARIIAGYMQGIVQQYSTEITMERLQRSAITSRLPSIDARLRVWYNPELKSINFMVPGVLCMILLVITMLLTSMAIVKEKELGTLEQLMVTPLSAGELMLGKTLPFLLFGLIDMAMVLLIAIFWFKVQMVGSVLLLVAISFLFLLSSLGAGIFVSAISRTQQEATLTSVFFFLPSILLAGFMFPIANMPKLVQYITYAIPLRYVLEVVRGIFLKGVGIAELWPQMLILAIFSVGILLVSTLLFQKRTG